MCSDKQETHGIGIESEWQPFLLFRFPSQGKPTDKAKEMRVKQYGELRAADYVPGTEVRAQRKAVVLNVTRFSGGNYRCVILQGPSSWMRWRVYVVTASPVCVDS